MGAQGSSRRLVLYLTPRLHGTVARYNMANLSVIASADDIPILDQHKFLDCAKEFEWKAVDEMLQECPYLVNVQPCGRDGTKRWSALHQAAYGGHANAVRKLLAHGAAADATTNDGKTPWNVAKNDAIRSVLREGSGGDAPRRPLATPARGKPPPIPLVLAMKKAMKKTTRKTKVAKGKRSKALVFKGKFERTKSGLKKEHLTKSKSGKVVSARKHAQGKSAYHRIQGWVRAMMKARTELGLVGFVAVKKGSPLYARTKEIYSSGA